jgi:diguanylate cyclase (GGDEF)-like protein
MALAMRVAAKLGIDENQPELVLAQYRAFTRQLPLMHFILLINCAALALTYHTAAPAVLTQGFPLAFCLAVLVRAASWLRARSRPLTVDQAAQGLRMVVLLIFLMGGSFAAWGFMLLGYGDEQERLHVFYFMTLSVSACVICLAQLRIAATGLILFCIVFLIASLSWGTEGVSKVIAVNGLLYCVTLLVWMHRTGHDFAALIQSKQVLAERTAEAVSLFEENHALATKDALTGLPNRRWFFAELAKSVEQARAGHHDFPVVAVIDLDGFKPVNDLHGHSAGDRILIEVGRRLERHANENLRIARMGGDEFAVILTHVGRRIDARQLGEAMCIDLGAPYRMGDFEAQVNASLGISLVAASHCSGGQLYEQADYALNYAKRAARGQVMFFSQDHAREIRDASRIDQALRAADLRAELFLNYQPIVEARSGRIKAFEALGRWNSPTLGPIPPTIFIAAAERSGRIGAITVELLSQMLRDMHRWPPHISLSFNLSVHDICSADTMARIAALIASSGMRPDRIDFEITETTILHDFAQARRTLTSLKGLGCGVALDDFGTGYSSLSYVHQLPLDKIKVDRSFVLDLGRDPVRLALTRSIMGLCDNLGLDCVVEGIEDMEQRELIGRLGAPLMQGYLFGKPASQPNALEMLAAEGTGELVELPQRDSGMPAQPRRESGAA